MGRQDGVGEALRIKQRYLPHWQAGGSTYFVTFDLEDRREHDGDTLSVEERQIVKEALLFWHHSKWQIYVLTVMPDHAHVLARPLEMSRGVWHPLDDILHSIKGYTAWEINRRRGRKGQLWQHEGHDRLVRDEREFHQKAEYIIHNAVAWGLVADPFAYDGLWGERLEEGSGLSPR